MEERLVLLTFGRQTSGFSYLWQRLVLREINAIFDVAAEAGSGEGSLRHLDQFLLSYLNWI